MSLRKSNAIIQAFNRRHESKVHNLPDLIEKISPVKTVDAETISLSSKSILRHADEKLFAYLRKNDVRLSVINKEALSKLNEILLTQLDGSHIGRHQIDLPAGFGKTSAIKCLVATIHELGLPYSLGISLERIDQIDELYDELVNELKIPESKIRRAHSGKKVPQTPEHYASLKDAQFLIFTQAKLKAAQFVDTYYKYCPSGSEKDLQLRDLLIWDESLISSLSFSEHFTSVVKLTSSAITDLEECLRDKRFSSDRSKVVITVLKFFREFRQFLDDHRNEDFDIPKILEVPVSRLATISPADINILPIEDDRSKDILRIYSGDKPSNFLRASTSNLNNKVVLTFKEILPAELENITVLDASASFRVATRLDDSFSFVKIKHDVAYAGSVAHIYDYNSGGTDIKGAFNGLRVKHRRIGWNEYESFAQDIAERIYSEEPDAEVLLSSYKDVIGSLERAVYMRLRSSVAVDANRAELQTITYGMETATNEYRDCQYIIEVGTFQAPDYAIDNLIAGQLGDERYDPNKLEELRDIVALTEMVHTFYQRTFRVQLRLNDPSRTISLYGFSKYREEIREVLEPRMPEFQWDFEDSPDPFAHAKVKRKELSSSESSLKKVERRFLYDYANLLVRNGPLTQKDIAESLAIPADTVKSNFQQWSRRKDREPYSLISKDDSSRPVRYFVNCEERLRSLQKRYEPDSLLGEKDSLTASG